MRGCFLKRLGWGFNEYVLPAYAGMFLDNTASVTVFMGSPRVCGDVSWVRWMKCFDERFSPRMRGCFRSMSASLLYGKVLPAYAGMFLAVKELLGPRLSSPRVCGDVSSFTSSRPSTSWFSPRMRGCFLKEALSAVTKCVLPAYAGMFLSLTVSASTFLGSPRVCGDVSDVF